MQSFFIFLELYLQERIENFYHKIYLTFLTAVELMPRKAKNKLSVLAAFVFRQMV